MAKVRDVAGARHAWWLLLVPLAVNALTGPYLVASGEDGDEQLVGVLLSAFCVLGIAVAWAHHGAPSRLLWGALWTVPAGFAGTAAVIGWEGGTGLAGYYAAIAVASALGLAMSAAPDASA